MALEIKRQRVTRVVEISLTSVYEQQIDVVDEDGDPLVQHITRVERIAFELNISEEEAERLVFSR